MTGGGGGGTTTSTSTSSPWAGQQPFLTSGFQRAEDLFQSDQPGYFPYSTVAPFAQETEQALQGQAQRATEGSPLLPAAQAQQLQGIQGGYLPQEGGVNPAYDLFGSTARGEMLNANPYRGEMFDALSGRVSQAVSSQFGRAGRQGSGGHAEATARALGDLGAQIDFADYGRERGLQQQAQQAIQGAFGQERGAQQASSMFAPQLAQQDYADIGRLADVGGVRQGQGQAQLSDLVNRWNFAQNQPQNQLNAFMGNVGGGYGGTTSSTVPYYSNMGAGILGGAATGAGIGSMFGANDFSSMLPYILAGGGLGGFG